ncbi:hypothetical protein B0I35DRAFT_437509 [Stachybotrys elegans]|uniref:Capsule polysaccharide biosynthesis protein n=1 Tax=Stachybotrys elegans TaxID=80388 RepID=A0A8K0SNP9_9HYPO|nr:hypothetical protein B0I35DRAFT_437509 [Stachybotrys elegans]
MEFDARFTMPPGVHAIPEHLLDLRPDQEIDQVIMNPAPVTDEKNIWFFWVTGWSQMHPYGQRTVRAWHRRLSKLGWVIRVLDRLPDSPCNVDRFLDVDDRANFPRAFAEGTVSGLYAAQHTSDLVRLPLLLRYGGVYSDVGMIQIGDLDRLWNETIANPASPYEIVTYNMGGAEGRCLTNYFLASKRDNPLFLRAHKLLLAMWAEDGGKTSTEGMHAHPLIKSVPMIPTGAEHTFEEGGVVYGPKEVAKLLADYIVQGQAISLVMGLVDDEDEWNGPQYVVDHIFAMEYMEYSQLINDMTLWDGPRQFELMSLPLPADGEAENADQKQAREIVQACLQRSFGFKLATGLIIRVLGQTLSSLWRANVGSDIVPGTFAYWLRHGTIYWNQDKLPARLELTPVAPYKVGPLLRDVE